ncbi:MAG: TIGR02556 family CRISPR-associated protein [Candidatus Omnitrophota bacterium]
MIEAIKEIGRIRLKGNGDISNVIESLTLDLPSEIKGKKQHLVILNYDIFDKQLDINFEEINEKTSQTYLWVGNEAGNNPQIYFTTDNVGYLISQTIPNLAEKIPKESDLRKIMQLAIKEIFYDLKLSGRYRYILDVSKIKTTEGIRLAEEGYLTKLLEKTKKETKDEKEIFKHILKDIESKVVSNIKSKTSLAQKDIGLYTLKINGKFMKDNKDYQELIAHIKIDSLFENGKGACSSCNNDTYITDSPEFSKAGSALGYYTTDKIGFSSNLSGRFDKNFAVCKDCYTKHLTGEVFVRNNLSSYIGGLRLYIVPKFIFQIELKQLNKWAEYIQSSFNSVKSLGGLKNFEEKLDEYREFEDSKNNFVLNFLFYESGQRNIKVLKLIKDTPPTRLDILRRATNVVRDTGDKILGVSNQWSIDLQSIYYLIPLRKTKEDRGFRIEYKKILGLYDSISSGKPVSYSFLIDQSVELAQVYRFEKFDAYNIGRQQNPDLGLVYAILKSNLLFLYLERLNIMKLGGDVMNYDSLQLKDEMKAFLKEMRYDEPKTALFLLGYVIGKIGNAQSELTESRTKPILNKINFEGMNPNKLIRLTNEVFEKLNQYKVFSKKEKSRVPLLVFNQGIFNEYKRLIDKEISNWQLSDHENIFYILSGYAYATHKALTSTSQNVPKDETKEEVKEDE